MDKRPFEEISQPGGYYHVYNRGNHQENIFLDEADYVGYLERLRKYKEEYKISLICYCLMPNHIHLLVRQDSKIPVYKFILPFHTSYSMYFNRKHNKIGHLFQGRFRQKPVTANEYLSYLSSYIHLNPFVHGLIDKLEDYQWSSYPDYIGLREGTLCDKKPILDEQSLDEYRQVTEEGIREKLIQKEFQETLSLNECP